MIRHSIILLSTTLLTLAACANTPPELSQPLPGARPFLPVEVEIIGDDSGKLPEYPVSGDVHKYRAYLQALHDERYKLKITNNSNQRVGLVIAVDGRNIISGQKSYLQNTERMYILNPHSLGEYEGWRSSQNQVNRFYFTEAADSYAAAWGDESAMGVIALAAYPERLKPQVTLPITDMARAAPGVAKNMERSDSAAGTGYGETTWSPSQIVSFEPQSNAMEKVFLKYEWRETLCRKGILSACQILPQPEQNRFWPDDNSGYAPPPPRRRY